MPSKILGEIKQSKPFKSPQEEAFLNVIRTADVLVRASEKLLRQYGLTFTQYNVLRILRGAGDAGAACREIGERMLTAEPDVTRLLDRMEKQRWVRRRRDTKDRRFVSTRITEEGRKLLESLEEPVRNLNRRQFSLLGREEIDRLIVALEKLREDSGPQAAESEDACPAPR